MKSCPTCNRTFADDTITFCLVDGSILSAPFDPQSYRPSYQPQNVPPPTAIMTSAPKPDDTVPSYSYPTIPAPPPSFMPEAKQGQRQKNSKLLLPIIVVLFITVVGLIIVVSRNSRSDKGRYTSNASTTNTDSFNNNISTTSQTSTTTQNMSASKAESSPTGKINMVGTWTGKSSGYSSTLIISAQEGNSFRGTKAIDTAATHYETAFNGDIDPVSRKVTIRETSLLRGTSDYSLGVETGLISSDGKEMSGDGTDKYATFTWSYSKQ